MSRVTYKIIEHDGGWAYTVSGVFSETYPSHAAALAAAKRAAAEQRTPGRSEVIEYETPESFELNRQSLASDARFQAYLQMWRAMLPGSAAVLISRALGFAPCVSGTKNSGDGA